MKTFFSHIIIFVLSVFYVSVAYACVDLNNDEFELVIELTEIVQTEELDNLYNYHDDTDIPLEMETDSEGPTKNLVVLFDLEIDDTVVFKHTIYLPTIEKVLIFKPVIESLKLIFIHIFTPPDIS